MAGTKKLSDRGFEEHFKNKLQDLEGIPPAESWDEIQGILDRDHASNHRWIVRVTILLLALLSEGFVYELSSSSTPSHDASVLRLATKDPYAPEITSPSTYQQNNKVNLCADAKQGVDHFTVSTATENFISHKITTKQFLINEKPKNIRSLLVINNNIPDGSVNELNLTLMHTNSDGAVNRTAGESHTITAHVHDHVSDSLLLIANVKEQPDTLSSNTEEDDKKEEKNRRRLSFQATAGINYTMKKITPTEDIYYLTALNNKNEVSLNNTGFQADVKLRYQLDGKNSMLVGLSWNRIKETTDYSYFNIIADHVEVSQVTGNAIGVSAYSDINNNKVQNAIDYFSFSLGMARKVIFLRKEYHALLELQVSKKIATVHTSATIDHRLYSKNSVFFIKGGIEKVHALSNGMQLIFVPFIRYSPGSIYSNESVYALKPIQAGLDVGIVIPWQ